MAQTPIIIAAVTSDKSGNQVIVGANTSPVSQVSVGATSVTVAVKPVAAVSAGSVHGAVAGVAFDNPA